MRNFSLIFIIFFAITIFKSSYSQELKICSIAKLHYSENEISQFGKNEIEKINYYFIQSYNIDTSNVYYNEFISKYCNNGFDITKFENNRKHNYTTWISFEEFPGLKLYLKSWKEIDYEYQRIENKN